MRAPFGLVVSALLVAGTIHAATVTVTDCAAPPVAKFNGRTVITALGDDVVVQCALLPLPGTNRVVITANSVTVDGPKGGSIAASGPRPSISLEALGVGPSGNGVLIDGADLSAPNNNGKIAIESVGAIDVTAGSSLKTGGDLEVECTGPGCTIDVTGTQTQSNHMRVLAIGTITIASTSIRTRCPRDLIVIISQTGDVIVTTNGGSGVCLEEIAKNCPGPNCPLPVCVCYDSVASAQAFCAPCDPGNGDIVSCIEGNLTIHAPLGKIDVAGTKIHIGEAIDFLAKTDVNMSNATIENCGPKDGVFSVRGTTCNVQGATLRDDAPEGAPTLSCTLVGTPTVIGSCSQQR